MIATAATLILWLVAGGYAVLLLGVIAKAIIGGQNSRGQLYEEASMRRLRGELARHE